MAVITKILGLLSILLAIISVPLTMNGLLSTFAYFPILFGIGIVFMILHKKSHKPVTPVDNQELSTFLSQFNCDKCRNNCRLDQIKCSRGQEFQQQKINEFHAN